MKFILGFTLLIIGGISLFFGMLSGSNNHGGNPGTSETNFGALCVLASLFAFYYATLPNEEK